MSADCWRSSGRFDDEDLRKDVNASVFDKIKPVEFIVVVEVSDSLFSLILSLILFQEIN